MILFLLTGKYVRMQTYLHSLKLNLIFIVMDHLSISLTMQAITEQIYRYSQCYLLLVI